MATYHVVSEDMQESAGWLKQNMQTLLDGMTQAKSKIDALIQGGYNTPQAQAKFGPYFEEYKSSVDQTLQGMEQHQGLKRSLLVDGLTSWLAGCLRKREASSF